MQVIKACTSQRPESRPTQCVTIVRHKLQKQAQNQVSTLRSSGARASCPPWGVFQESADRPPCQQCSGRRRSGSSTSMAAAHGSVWSSLACISLFAVRRGTGWAVGGIISTAAAACAVFPLQGR